MADKSKKTNFTKISSIIDNYQVENGRKYISKEFQDYGYRLALELNDEKRISLYIKLAKETDRSLLEQARSFVKDAVGVKSKAKLFMWKLDQLKKGKLHK